MATAHQIEIKNRLLTSQMALGNTQRGLKEVCSDLLNDFIKGKTQMKSAMDGTFLCKETLERMMKLDETDNGYPYRPNADTCERILRFFGAAITFDQVRITPKFQNKPKETIQ